MKHTLLEFINDNRQIEKCKTIILTNLEVFIPLSGMINIEEEIKNLTNEINKLTGEIKRCEGMLNNPNFLSRAPEAKVNDEKRKLENYQKQLEEVIALKAALNSYEFKQEDNLVIELPKETTYKEKLIKLEWILSEEILDANGNIISENIPYEKATEVVAGNYLIAINQRVSRLQGAESVELLYNNAVVANLLVQDYILTANQGENSGYALRVHRKAQVSTATDNISGSTITLIANDGYISLTGVPTDAKVNIYDMLGRLIATQNADGQTVINMPMIPQGVYNIVINSTNGHQTMKTIIR